MRIAGIDCGLDGAIAIWNDEARQVEAIFDMPTFQVRAGKRDLDAQAIVRFFKDTEPDHVWIEEAIAIPRQSAYSTGIFFKCYGLILGIIAMAEIPHSTVSPRSWKRALGVPAEKDAARARASQLLPSASGAWKLKKHDGRAEAALLAYYGSLQIAPRRHRA